MAALEAAIRDYLASHNANPKPFVWSKTAHTILEKERRAFNALEVIKAGYQPSESEHMAKPRASNLVRSNMARDSDDPGHLLGYAHRAAQPIHA